jgi:hypothetical protein
MESKHKRKLLICHFMHYIHTTEVIQTVIIHRTVLLILNMRAKHSDTCITKTIRKSDIFCTNAAACYACESLFVYFFQPHGAKLPRLTLSRFPQTARLLPLHLLRFSSS